LWGQEGYGFKEDFLQLTRKNYGAGFKEVNFGNAEEARQRINRWVAEQTKDKIKELLGEGRVNGQTRLVLTTDRCANSATLEF
jgi:serpin B